MKCSLFHGVYSGIGGGRAPGRRYSAPAFRDEARLIARLIRDYNNVSAVPNAMIRGARDGRAGCAGINILGGDDYAGALAEPVRESEKTLSSMGSISQGGSLNR